MVLFIDTANLDEIKEVSTWGYVKGVTTNPSLIAKEGLTQEDVISQIVKLIDGPISAEVTCNDDYQTMIKQAEKLYQINPKNIVIKLPINEDGLKVCHYLSEKGIPTNLTLCFSPNQALLAMEAGASYVSPFLGRLDDIGEDSYRLIREIVTIKRNYNYQTKIIAASIRSPEHVKNCALIGSDIATVPFKVLAKLKKHHLTDSGLDTFAKDAAKTAALLKKDLHIEEEKPHENVDKKKNLFC